jgi:hypothetical protein
MPSLDELVSNPKAMKEFLNRLSEMKVERPSFEEEGPTYREIAERLKNAPPLSDNCAKALLDSIEDLDY